MKPINNLHKEEGKMVRIMVMIVAALMIFGCAGNRAIIETARTGVREDVFQKLDGPAAPLAGYADLQITSSIKTHREGAYFFEQGGHGTADFVLLINVDGHALTMQGEAREEAGTHLELSDPEAGLGMRYTFNQWVRLKPGKHTLTIAIPEDDIVWQQHVEVMEGKNRIDIKPIYLKTSRKRPVGFRGDSSFTAGLKGIKILINNKEYPSLI